jgi:hypothetical protein
MSLKLQLAKTFYYSDPKRIAIIRRLEMEEAVCDAQFVAKARKLLELDCKEKRENLFVDLVKDVFFSVILEGLSEFELFMEKKNEGLFLFNKNRFKESQGFCKKCKSGTFWVGVTENSNFQQLVKYFKKYDESNVSRFTEIVKHARNPSLLNSSVFNFTVVPQVSFANLLESLEKLNENNDPQKAFSKETTRQVIQELQEVFNDFRFISEDSEFYYTGLARRNTLSFATSRETIDFRQFPRIFYGKFGLIRTLSALISGISTEDFSQLTFIKKSLEEEISTVKKNEISLLKLLYSLKNDRKFQDFQKIIEQFIILNQKNPEMLPAHLVFFYLDKVFEENPVHVQMLVSVEGKLGRIAKDVVTSKTSSRKESDDMYDKNEILKSYKSLRSTSENWGIMKIRI